MRQLNKYTGRHQSEKRGFLTETQFLRFAESRIYPDLTNMVRPAPNSSLNTILIEESGITEETTRPAIAKAAGR